MGKSAASKQAVAEYSMSIHAGICHGPVDAITGLYVGEKLAWSGEVTQESAIYVNAPSLFGGPKDEGGVGGVMFYLPGGPAQVMPNALAARFGLTTNTCPAFRGVASVFFIGTDSVPAGSLDTGGTTTGGSYPVGGDGSGGGTTTGGGGAGCVVVDAYMPSGSRARAVEPGAPLTVLHGDADGPSKVVGVILLKRQPCVTLRTFSGIELTVSKQTPFTKQDGRVISVMDCMNEMCAVRDGNGFRWERIWEVREAGRHDVMKIDADGKTYAAGDVNGRYLFTHNKAVEPIE